MQTLCNCRFIFLFLLCILILTLLPISVVDEDVVQEKLRSPDPINANELKPSDQLIKPSESILAPEVNNGLKSSSDIFLCLKSMKDNNSELSLDVGGMKKTYCFTFDPDDTLSDQYQVTKGNLLKRVYSKEETKTKWREKLFGYDVYWGYNATVKQQGYICPAMICNVDDGSSTGLVLKRILRTRCAKPQLWMVIYCIADDQCYIVNKLISTWMARDPKTKLLRAWWTNPNVVFDHEKCSK